MEKNQNMTKQPANTDYLDWWIHEMHSKFGIAYIGPPRALDEDEKKFRLVCLQEELDEYVNAETRVDELDALIDLIVFAVGTLYRHGYPVRAAYETVMQCNMTKEVAGTASRSKRSFSTDLVKPDGWVGPEKKLQGLLDLMERFHG